MNKLITRSIVCLTAFLGLTSCAQTVSHEGLEKRLQDKGYTVTWTDAKDYKNSSLVFDEETFLGYLNAAKASVNLEDVTASRGEFLQAYLFKTIDAASSQSDAILRVLANSEYKTGTYNNVIYIGSEKAIEDAGFKI